MAEQLTPNQSSNSPANAQSSAPGTSTDVQAQGQGQTPNSENGNQAVQKSPEDKEERRLSLILKKEKAIEEKLSKVAELDKILAPLKNIKASLDAKDFVAVLSALGLDDDEKQTAFYNALTDHFINEPVTPADKKAAEALREVKRFQAAQEKEKEEARKRDEDKKISETKAWYTEHYHGLLEDPRFELSKQYKSYATSLAFDVILEAHEKNIELSDEQLCTLIEQHIEQALEPAASTGKFKSKFANPPEPAKESQKEAASKRAKKPASLSSKDLDNAPAREQTSQKQPKSLRDIWAERQKG